VDWGVGISSVIDGFAMLAPIAPHGTHGPKARQALN